MNAIGYIRVSTLQQGEEDRYGVEAQKQAISAYARANGYEIVDWKEDRVSGAADDRPALTEILYGDVENPPIEAVIVYKNDRLARDTKLYFYYLYTLDKKGIKLISTQEEFPESSDFVNIYRALLQFVAEQERKNIAIRTQNGRKVKASGGGYSGGRAPYGYRVEDGNLVVQETEAQMVREIFTAHDTGASLSAICCLLSNRGYTTRKGTTFSPAGVKSILDNRPLYEGMYRYGDMDWVRGTHDPILDLS